MEFSTVARLILNSFWTCGQICIILVSFERKMNALYNCVKIKMSWKVSMWLILEGRVTYTRVREMREGGDSSTWHQQVKTTSWSLSAFIINNHKYHTFLSWTPHKHVQWNDIPTMSNTNNKYTNTCFTLQFLLNSYLMSKLCTPARQRYKDKG